MEVVEVLIVKKKVYKIMGVVVICWLILGVVEGLRLIGSTNPGNSPLLSIRSKQIADEVAEYGSLGFSQTYYLTEEDTFVSGEFRVLGIRIAHWE